MPTQQYFGTLNHNFRIEIFLMCFSCSQIKILYLKNENDHYCKNCDVMAKRWCCFQISSQYLKIKSPQHPL